MKKLKITKEQYDRLVSESLNIKGGPNRVNNTFKKDFTTSAVKNLGEDTFDIAEPIAGMPKTKMKTAKPVPMPEAITEGLQDSEVQQAIYRFIENIWLNPSQKGLDKFFIDNGITWGDIISYLTSVGIVTGIGAGIYKINNFFKRMFNKNKNKATEEKKEDIKKMAELVAKNPRSPWQKKLAMQQKPDSGFEAKPKPFDPTGRKMEEVKEKPQMFKPIAMNYEVGLFNGPDGIYVLYFDEHDKENFPDRQEELSIEELTDYLNNNFDRMKKGVGMAGWDSDAELIKLDDELKQVLLKLYNKNKNFVNALSGLQEMTSTASSGAFTTKLGDTTHLQNSPSEVIEEMDTTSAGDSQTSSTTGAYVQPAIWANGKKNWKPAKKTQYPKGEMVDFDSCTKLNNNKSAQNGKCSTGAADNVVKTHGTKQSVISKTIYEEIAKRTGKTVEEVQKIINTKINNTNSLA